MAIEYYYNVDTGEIEVGKQSDGKHLMGPYASREEAEGALAKAEERNEKWEAEDEEWDSWGDDD